MSVDELINKFGGLTEEYLFYNGEVTLHYDPRAHLYLLAQDGDLIPQEGVTTVCHILDKSSALIPWACKMMAGKLLSESVLILPDGSKQLRQMDYQTFENLILAAKTAHKDKLEEAGDIGHIAHAWIERYIKAILYHGADSLQVQELLAKFPADERAANCCMAALDWMRDHNVRWLGTERKIYSRRYGYAGTMDGLCRVDSCSNPHCCKTSFQDRLTISDWKCLLPEQTLLRYDGSTVRADQVMPGDRLIAYDEATSNFVGDIVKEVRPGGTQPCVEVLSSLGRRLRVSSNHPVLVNGKWKDAGDLEPGDSLLVYAHRFEDKSGISEDDARLLGYFVGDGGFSDPTSRTFTNTNPHVMEDFTRLCKNKGFTVKPSGKNGLKKSQYNIGGCGSFLRDHGIYCCGSKQKIIPSAVLSGSMAAAVAFISAYFDCDGYIAKTSVKRPDVCFTTVSARLASETQELLQRLGVNANVWRQDNKKYKKMIHDSPPYWIKVNCQTESKKLLSLLDLRVQSKKQRQSEWLVLLSNNKDKVQRKDSVKSVTQLGEFPTIGIEMERTGTFITSGIVTHNTSNYLYIEYLLQTAAYLSAHNEEETYVAEVEGRLPQLAVDRWIIRLGKEDGVFSTWHAPEEDYTLDFASFVTALALKRRTEAITQRVKDRESETRASIKAEKKADRTAAILAERERKAEKKEQLRLARDLDLKIKCPKADKFQGTRRPKGCNGTDTPCETCLAKWAVREFEKLPGAHHQPITMTNRLLLATNP